MTRTGGGGGLVAGENHGRDLIAELRLAEGLAGFRIARRVQQVEQIARRRAFRLSSGATFRHQHADEGRPSLAETRPREIPRRRPIARQHQCSRKSGRASRSP